MRKICCFTGYRPEKLIYLKDPRTWEAKHLYKTLEASIIEAIEDGYDYFISGFARGVDLIAAEIVLKQRDIGQKIALEAAIPCPEQTRGWSESEREAYRNILRQVNYRVYLGSSASSTNYLKRNRYMVDKSQRVIAVYDGAKGGTGYTVTYCRKLSRELVIIDPHTFNVNEENMNESLF